MKISVVAIFYNSEQYVRKCLDSIINQKGVELEIIAVNDCSTDSTSEILKEYGNKYSSIKIITHDTNQGIASARNSGLHQATGDGFYLIDGDDYLASSIALATMCDKFDSETDWVQGSYLKVNTNGEIIGKISFQNASYSSYDSICDNFGQLDFIYTHNKLINIKFAKHLFMTNVYHEDRIWNAKIFKQLNKVITLSEPTYCYLIHQGQTSGNSRKKRLYVDSSMILLKQMVVLPKCWKPLIDTVHIVDIEKPLYLWEKDAIYRKTILKECNKLNNIEIDFSSFPRATCLIHRMISKKIPDFIINLVAKSYVKVLEFLKHPL